MIPPARAAHLHPETTGGPAPATELLEFGEVGDTASAAGEANAEGKGHEAELVAVADRARFVEPGGVMIGDPPELGLRIADLFAIPAPVAHRVDHALSRQSVADDPHGSCGAKPTCHAATLPQI